MYIRRNQLFVNVRVFLANADDDKPTYVVYSVYCRGNSVGDGDGRDLRDEDETRRCRSPCPRRSAA